MSGWLDLASVANTSRQLEWVPGANTSGQFDLASKPIGLDGSTWHLKLMSGWLNVATGADTSGWLNLASVADMSGQLDLADRADTSGRLDLSAEPICLDSSTWPPDPIRVDGLTCPPELIRLDGSTWTLANTSG